MIDPNEDGVSHINIYSKGQTELGQLLSNFAYTPFIHPEDGKFDSVEGYWYWLSCKERFGSEALRMSSGFAAKKLGRMLNGKDYLEDEEFKRKVCLAIKCKVEQHPHILSLMRENKLPYKHYYLFGDKVVEPKEGLWVVEYIRGNLTC